ncbi:MAG: glycosyltransferase family 2 protein [Thermoleophilia bacterium]|nr:glycosyltransferase family 2 protein [Thermoleophilia bacterium]
MNEQRLRTLWPETRFGRWMNDDCREGLVSVILPTFNRSRLLLESLESVRRQRYRPIELLIIDDGSTDDTSRILRDWVGTVADDTDLVVRCLRQENAGAPTARNHGLLECRGGFIQFLDSDDILHPDKLTKQIDALDEDSQADYVYSGSAYFSDVVDWSLPAYCGLQPVQADRPVLGFLRGGAWQTVSGLYRRRACVANGPWAEDVPIYQDWDYNVRFLLGEPKTILVKGTLSLQRSGTPDRITATMAGRCRSERSMRGIFSLHQKWYVMIGAAGQLDADTERVLADPMVELVKQALLHGRQDLARDISAWLRGMAISDAWSRRLAIFRLLLRLPAPWCTRLAQSYECLRVWTLPVRRMLHLTSA